MSQVIVPLIASIIVAVITWFVATNYRQKTYETKIGSAEERSREIIDEALKVAETKKREALLEAKEESLKTKNELEKEMCIRDRCGGGPCRGHLVIPYTRNAICLQCTFFKIAEDLIPACRKHVVAATGPSSFKVGGNQRPERTMSGAAKTSA